MPAFKSLVGNKYGRLTAISVAQRAKRKPHQRTMWLCLCECGKTKAIAANALVHGLTKSCGCMAEEYLSTVRLPSGLAGMRQQINRYRFQAADRNLPWSLNESDCIALFSSDCHYCGATPQNILRPSNGSRHGGGFYNGIDRIDSDLGYVAGNVVSSCFICNRAKSVLGYRQFIEWIERCSAHLRTKGRKTAQKTDSPNGRLFA